LARAQRYIDSVQHVESIQPFNSAAAEPL
jgi:hypothetical protein